MKTKLGTVKLLQGQNYSSYTSIVKKTLPDLVKSPEPVPYILISGTHLPWKAAPNDPAQPLFYVGNTKDWIKWTKASKTLTLKDYSYGTCKVAMQGDKAQIRLVSEKGQLTNPMPFKPLGKIFEKMKPKMFFTVVEKWEAAPVTRGGAPKADPGVANDLAKKLLTYHTQFIKVQESLKKAKNPKQKETATNNKKQLLAALKQLCAQWKTAVVDTGMDTAPKNLQQAQKVYGQWSVQLGTSGTTSGGNQGTQAAVINKTFAPQVSTLRQGFETDVENVANPDKIEEHIQKLSAKVQEWELALKKAQQSLTKEFQEFKTYADKAQQDWVKLRKPYSNWIKIQQEIDTKGLSPELFEALEAANAKIQAFS